MKFSKIIWIAVLSGAAIAGAACACLLSGCTKDAPKGGKTAELSFHSFDGGGPEYSFSIKDPDIADFTTQRKYDKPDHEELDGAGYDVVLTLTGKKAGKTVLTAEYSSPIGDSGVEKYSVTVADDLSVTAKQLSDTDSNNEDQEMIVLVSGHTFYAEVADNPSAEALWKKLEKSSMVLSLKADGDKKQKSASLSAELPPYEATQESAQAGDLVLYDGNRLALCSGDCPGECALLARLKDFDEALLSSAMDNEPTELTLLSKWPER